MRSVLRGSLTWIQVEMHQRHLEQWFLHLLEKITEERTSPLTSSMKNVQTCEFILHIDADFVEDDSAQIVGLFWWLWDVWKRHLIWAHSFIVKNTYYDITAMGLIWCFRIRPSGIQEGGCKYSGCCPWC